MNFKFRVAAISLLALSIAPSAFSATAYDLMTRDLTPSIKSLKSDTRLYHYFWTVADKQDFAKTKLKKSDEREKFLKDRLANTSNSFFTSTSTAAANAGNGLYLAIDPHSSSPDAAKYYSPNGQFSKGFGDTMLEMTLVAGTKMINLENSNKIIIKADTLAALSAEGISLNKPAPGPKDYPDKDEPLTLMDGNRFSRDTVRYMARPGAEKFRNLINKILKDNQISLIQYSWQSSVSYFCGANSARLTAFVYIGNHGLNLVSSNSMVYWPAPNLPEMTHEEMQTYTRSKLMYDAFTQTRPQEMIWTKTTDKVARKQAVDTLRALNAQYFSDVTYTNDLKAHTFECVK